jgi:hypothetical protein
MSPIRNDNKLPILRPNEKGKILLPGAVRKEFFKPGNFDKIKKKLEATGKLDVEDFNSAKDLGMFIDWYNQLITNSKKSRAENEILEISKLLAKISGRKSFVFGGHKKD